MNYIIALIFTLSSFYIKAQVSDSTISFKLDFYVDDVKQNLTEIDIQIVHTNSESSDFFDSEFSTNNDSTIRSTNIKKGDNILLSQSSDSITIKKSTGNFQIIVKYRNHTDSTGQGYSYFQYGGHVVIGIITDLREFRTKMYKKHKILKLYKEEQFELETQYPYLTVVDIYGFKNNPSLYYISTKMNTNWGEGNWWGTSSRQFKLE